ncbi:indole-3-glycerol phosphate synthase [Clostridia bacterium]|nr:indole-3-glycerol phosphate synthase [Clostridia bacterium]
MTILDEIAAKTRERVNKIRTDAPHRFSESLKTKSVNGIAFICEVKRASPSKGMIAEDFPYLEIAREYERAGAAAISVLTEPHWFKGDNRYLFEIATAVNIPILRKDFTVDPYMIYEAKALGASAVLLIAAILTDTELRDFLNLAESLGLEAIVETHSETEVERAIKAGASIIGVNNRDLTNMTVDLTMSEKLRKLIPPGVIFISESGIKTADDVSRMKAIGADALLIGETLMRSSDKAEALRSLSSGDK